jgi:hypothetical protein
VTVVVMLTPGEPASFVSQGSVAIDGRVELRLRSGEGHGVVAQVAASLAENPAAKADDVCREIGRRRGDVLRPVKTIRATQVEAEAGPSTPERPVRYPERRNRSSESQMGSASSFAWDDRVCAPATAPGTARGFGPDAANVTRCVRWCLRGDARPQITGPQGVNRSRFGRNKCS